MSQNPAGGVLFTMTTRTMLPPNLTRHYWEAYRTRMAAAGVETEQWFQLDLTMRAVLESEVEMLREAIRSAEEEQDLIAAVTTPAPAENGTPASEQSAAADSTPENCPCPGCSAVAAYLRLTGVPAERLEESLGWQVLESGQGSSVIAFRAVPLEDSALSPEERARIRKAAEKAINQWVADGRPLEVLSRDSELPQWTLGMDPPGGAPITFEGLRRKFFDPQFITGLGKL